jgi:hypothetical protein
VPRGQRPSGKGRLGPEGTLYGNDMAKPIPIAIVAAFLWIAMLIGLAVGVALLFPGTFLDRMWEYNRPAHAAFQTVGKTSGVGFLVLGLIVGVTAGVSPVDADGHGRSQSSFSRSMESAICLAC